MRRTESAGTDIAEIRKNYDWLQFRCAVEQLHWAGASNFTPEAVREAAEHIRVECEDAASAGETLVMTQDYRIGILQCADLLSRVPLWDLIAYLANAGYVETEA